MTDLSPTEGLNMKRERYSEEQIVAAVKLHEQGTAAVDICRELGIAEATFYRWRQQYRGLGAGQAITTRSRKDTAQSRAKPSRGVGAACVVEIWWQGDGCRSTCVRPYSPTQGISPATAMPRGTSNAAKVRELMRLVGREALGMGRIYLVGGASAVLVGWRDTTVDVEALWRLKLIESGRLIRRFEAIEPDLSRYPAIDPVHFRDRVRQAITASRTGKS